MCHPGTLSPDSSPSNSPHRLHLFDLFVFFYLHLFLLLFLFLVLLAAQITSVQSMSTTLTLVSVILHLYLNFNLLPFPPPHASPRVILLIAIVQGLSLGSLRTGPDGSGLAGSGL
jgi:hypothetical protein